MEDKIKLQETFLRLYDVIEELREKCPWDREQTNESLRHLTLEEVYELSEAVLKGDSEELKTELGDVLLHVLFYSRIAQEQNEFNTTDMMQSLIDKLIRRHPHIYGEHHALGSSKEVIENWEKIKLKEKKNTKESVLSGVPENLPSLLKAYRIQDKVSNVGFDWEKKEQVWEKVKEELEEFENEVQKIELGGKNTSDMEGEFGDVLFSLINYARYLNINPEDALSKTNNKFTQRFKFLESESRKEGKSISEMSLAEMDVYWEKAKTLFR